MKKKPIDPPDSIERAVALRSQVAATIMAGILANPETTRDLWELRKLVCDEADKIIKDSWDENIGELAR